LIQVFFTNASLLHGIDAELTEKCLAHQEYLVSCFFDEVWCSLAKMASHLARWLARKEQLFLNMCATSLIQSLRDV
jgi:hypothetical protein